MSLETVLAEDRRLVILRTLSEVTSYALNESVLRKALEAMGHSVGGDLVRFDIVWLGAHDLVRVETLHPPSGDLWLVHLTETGNDVAQGRVHPGVARRGPG